MLDTASIVLNAVPVNTLAARANWLMVRAVDLLWIQDAGSSAVTAGISSDGGYAEYVTVRRESVVRIPEGMAPEIAGPLLCAGVTVYSASLHSTMQHGRILTTTIDSLRNMDVSAGDIVAVQGIG